MVYIGTGDTAQGQVNRADVAGQAITCLRISNSRSFAGHSSRAA